MIDFKRLEATIRRDPGERGLASYCDEVGQPLCAGHLEKAVAELARCRGGRVLIVTGFCILTDDGPRAETDGPPGAIYLADRLRQAGFEVAVATEDYASWAVSAGCDGARVAKLPLLRFPNYGDSEGVRQGVGEWRQIVELERFTHLVAVERVGPSHDGASIDPVDREAFLSLVEPDHRGVCHNMRGISIDQGTVPLHLLFESLSERDVGRDRPSTIGIVDGGNEIGCGGIPWSVLRKAIKQGPAERTACRVATDSTIIAGVSNWGAYALGAALAARRGGAEGVDTWRPDRLRSAIEGMVEHGGAVDGVTKRPEATVDGLPLEVELGMLDEIHAIVRGA